MLMMAVVVVVEKMMISSSKCETSVAWCLNPIMTPLFFFHAGDTSNRASGCFLAPFLCHPARGLDWVRNYEIVS